MWLNVRRGKKILFLLRTGAWVLGVRAGLWILPMRAVRGFSLWGTRRSARVHDIQKIVWSVNLTSRYVPAATCLTQAMVVQRLLTQSGYRSTLHVGVAKREARGFESHAWVEHAGRVVIGEAAGESVTDVFTPMTAWER